jgi:hypothetical protein
VRIEVKTREPAPEPLPAEPEDRARTERVREALRCPFCRDAVGRKGAVACARRGCGATYHRECWGECATDYGGCAVFGCGSTSSRELTTVGFLLRLARLLLAALLFPPRALRAVRRAERAGAFWPAYERARRIYASQNRDGGVQAGWVLFLGVPVSYALVFASLAVLGRGFTEREVPWIMALLFGIPFGMLALPALVALGALLLWYGARAIVAGLRDEVGVLERQDRGETVLQRLARGIGKKG